ncbi:hypothetical protein FSP39_015349 [Pinctada imbricata]|uniref:Uncharacterized protein n=1 Tax=Pinctada imbricata TaxID=66713 RepID=A0AA88XEM9_PINIB|nr:hypothetical protein FSP39_015349 [Pinctada imbricata]
MDISPGSTPTNSRPSSSIGTPQIPGSTPASLTTPCVTLTTSIGSNNSSLSNLPQIINQLGGTQNNQEVTQQALQTLQKLQQLISQQIAQQRSSSSTVPSRNTVPLDNACHQQTHQTVTSSARLPGQQIHNAHHGHLTQYPPQHINNSQSVQCSPMNSHPHSHHPHSQGNTHSTMNALSSPQTHVTSNHIVSSQGQLIVQNSLHHPQHHAMHTSMTDTNGARGNTVISSAPAHTGSVYGRVMNNQGQQSYAPLHVDTSNSVMVDRGGGDRSPRMGGGAGGSPRSSCGSPSSTTSSQEHHPIGDQAVPAAGMNKTESPNIGPSHSNYYNDRLIGHVTGWQADHAQRQALRYWEEGINIGSFHCGQISVELKRARSLVRLAEIQSTLHEQR